MSELDILVQELRQARLVAASIDVLRKVRQELVEKYAAEVGLNETEQEAREAALVERAAYDKLCAAAIATGKAQPHKHIKIKEMTVVDEYDETMMRDWAAANQIASLLKLDKTAFEKVVKAGDAAREALKLPVGVHVERKAYVDKELD